MRMRLVSKSLVLGVWLVFSAPILEIPTELGAGASHAAEKTIRAVQTEIPPKIDGKLDDPCWKQAAMATDFIQTYPDEGELAKDQTVVYVLYDDENLYVAFDCESAHPDKIVCNASSRDSSPWGLDFVELVLDTFHDHQNCFAFYVTPAGVQMDGRGENDGGLRQEWDGVWYCTTSINDKGWIAEIAIPFKTLRFPRAKEQTWGINFSRTISYPYGWGSWTFLRRIDGGGRKVSKAGHLIGLKDLKQGLHLEILPYVTGKHRRHKLPDAVDEWQKDLGIDVKYGITSNITADVTVNPDFAQIEADEYEINLSRFELYLWEKRPFFLEGRELFNTPFQLFYTRRINNPSWGVKITGKKAGLSFLALDAVDEEGQGSNPNYAVLRLTKDILKNSNIGIIAASKDWKGGHGRAFGVDTHLSFGDRIRFKTQIAKSANPGVKGSDRAINIQLEYLTRTINAQLKWRAYEPEFDVNQTGFFHHDPHVGNRRAEGSFKYTYSIEKHGLDQLELVQQISQDKDSNETGWQRNYSTQAILSFRNGDNIWGTYSNWYFIYDQRGYKGKSYVLHYWMAPRGVFGGVMGGALEDHYDWPDHYFGYIRRLGGWLVFNLRPDLSMDVSMNNVWEYYASGRFDEFKQIANIRLTYYPTHDLFWRNYIQLNPRTDEYYFNALVAYTFRPFSKVYLAYNESWDKSGGKMGRKDKIVFMKVAYLLNL